jgi:hypothetical protein
MRRFVPIHSKTETTIHEVECEEIFSHPWEVQAGEKRYRVNAPKQFLNHVWYSWAVCEDDVSANVMANLNIRSDFARAAEKTKQEFDEAGFLATVNRIKTVLL